MAWFYLFVAGGLEVVATTVFRYTDPFAALMEPLVTPEARKKQVADFARLKAKAEAASL